MDTVYGRRNSQITVISSSNEGVNIQTIQCYCSHNSEPDLGEQIFREVTAYQ